MTVLDSLFNIGLYILHSYLLVKFCSFSGVEKENLDNYVHNVCVFFLNDGVLRNFSCCY